jgi:hypothetical protein
MDMQMTNMRTSTVTSGISTLAAALIAGYFVAQLNQNIFL